MSQRAGARQAWIVLTGLFAISVLVGWVGYRNYISSESEITGALADMRSRGGKLAPEECVDDVLGWHGECQALKTLCDATVYRMMEACLEAGSRDAFCSEVGSSSSITTFGHANCKERDLDRAGRKACAAAYRAIDTHCKRDESVAAAGGGEG